MGRASACDAHASGAICRHQVKTAVIDLAACLGAALQSLSLVEKFSWLLLKTGGFVAAEQEFPLGDFWGCPSFITGHLHASMPQPFAEDSLSDDMPAGKRAKP